MNTPHQNLPKSPYTGAFSLIELLSVMALVGVMLAMLVPVFSGSSQAMNRAAETVSDVLQQARTHAMSKNTYVYVGMSSTQGPTPELALAVVEAGDGLASRTNDLAVGHGASSIRPLRRAVFLRGVDLATDTAKSNLPGTALPPAGGVQVDQLESSAIRFPANLVTPRQDVTGAVFDWVVQFGPDGAANLDATARTVPGYVVLGLIPAAGSAANSVGVIIDGPSGAVRVVRPES